MFTGLVETTGELRSRERRGPGFRLGVACSLGPLEFGESVAVSGACLTVIAHDDRGFEADVSQETADKTTLGRLALGARLNLERSLWATLGAWWSKLPPSSLATWRPRAR